MTNVMLTCRLERSGVAVGAAQNVAPTEGSATQNKVGSVTLPPSIFRCFCLLCDMEN